MIIKSTRNFIVAFLVALMAGFSSAGAPTITQAVMAAPGTGCLPGVLKKRLGQIRKRFGKLRIVSTFRRGARIRGTGRPSYHASCRAVDFHPPRGKYKAVARWLKANHGGGVGTYSCRMRHIHIDNGPRVRFHKCIR